MLQRFLDRVVVVIVVVISIQNISTAAEEVTFEGSVLKIEGEKIIVKDAAKEQSLTIGPATKITSGGKPASSMDLKVGQRVKCLIQKMGDEMMCTSLEVMRM